MPKVSVILPTYNCAHYLQESINSILSQSFKDLEVIIVDDGSSDNAAEVAAGYKSDGRVSYVWQNHSGLAAARNTGIARARGEYITFIDADDLFLTDRIARQVEVLDSNRAVDIVYTAWRYFYDNDTADSVSSPYAKLSGDILFFLKRNNFIPIVTAMIRRSSMGEVLFDPGLKSHEDWDFWLRLSFQGKRFFCIDEELTLIRVRKDSMTYEHPVMSDSRAIVGKRARQLWISTKRREPLRYIMMRLMAWAINFPHAARFNKPSPFKK